jgi:hypothetical protein
MERSRRDRNLTDFCRNKEIQYALNTEIKSLSNNSISSKDAPTISSLSTDKEVSRNTTI